MTQDSSNHYGFILTVALVASVAGLLMGFDTGVISGALGFIAKTFHLTQQDYTTEEFIVSAVPIGAFIGAIASNYFTQKFGRRNSIFITAVLFVIGSLITAVAVNIEMVIIGRLIMGFAVGLSAMAVPLYLSEISPKNIRGTIVFTFQLSVTVGLLLAFVINYIFAQNESWREMFLVGLALGVLLGVGIVFLPKSPRWLLLKGRKTLALESLRRLRFSEDVQTEFDEISQALKHHEQGFLALFKKPLALLVVLTVGLFAFQQLSGVNTIFYYAATIFKHAGFDGKRGAILASVASGLINVIASIIAAVIIDFVGRRKLLFTGFVGMIICLLFLGLAYLDVFASQKALISLITVLGFILFFAISLGGIPYVMMSEVFPLSIRHTGMAVASCANWGFNVIVSSTFLTLVHTLSIGYTFILYAAFTVVGFVFCYFLMPETKGVSLENIQEKLYSGKKLRHIGL